MSFYTNLLAVLLRLLFETVWKQTKIINIVRFNLWIREIKS